jgi:hypothetical protein
MTLVSYENSPFVIRADLIAAHERVWGRLANAGTCLEGETRVKIAREARHARNCALCDSRHEALSPFMVDGDHDVLTDLSEGWIEIIHRIVTDPGRLTKGWCEKMLGTGIDEGDYVEIVSIVAHVTAIDMFAHTLGLDPQPLPEAVAGEPTHYRPAEARLSDCWVANIPFGEHGPDEEDFCGGGRRSNIRRALTLVPDEARSFFDLATHQYLPGSEMLNPDTKIRAISRAQIELLAGRVSAINQCTY